MEPGYRLASWAFPRHAGTGAFLDHAYHFDQPFDSFADAVQFWKVIDPMKTALGVADCQSTINWAAQTALHDVIGKTFFAEMLEGREKISAEF